MTEKTTHFPSIKDVPDSAWKKLAQKKIYFGHQSVGFNIINGIKDVKQENPQINLNIVETSNPTDFDAPALARFWVGKNMDPGSKIEAFTSFMKKITSNRADIAFFKFCFVDITANTDVQKIFTDYRNAMSRLKVSYPRTTFIHVTVPLTCMPTGIKGWIRRVKNLIKKVIGRPVFHLQDNSKRYQYNEMLRKEYEGKAPIFDLAKIESTFPDGRRPLFSKHGRTYYSLVPDYTYDGGHLNEAGRKILAEQLLILLANLSK